MSVNNAVQCFSADRVHGKVSMTKSHGACLENILEKNAASWYFYINNGAAPIDQRVVDFMCRQKWDQQAPVNYWTPHLYFWRQTLSIFNLRKIYINILAFLINFTCTLMIDTWYLYFVHFICEKNSHEAQIFNGCRLNILLPT